MGAGGHLALSLAARCPSLVDGLVLVSTCSQGPGWLEWAQHKVTLAALRRGRAPNTPDSVLEWLVWHHLGPGAREKGSRRWEISISTGWPVCHDMKQGAVNQVL